MLQQTAEIQETRQERSGAMLDMGFEDDLVVMHITPEQTIVACDVCGKEALIFQEEGDFCLGCWQDRTEPDITIKDVAKHKSSC